MSEDDNADKSYGSRKKSRSTPAKPESRVPPTQDTAPMLPTGTAAVEEQLALSFTVIPTSTPSTVADPKEINEPLPSADPLHVAAPLVIPGPLPASLSIPAPLRIADPLPASLPVPVPLPFPFQSRGEVCFLN